MYSKATAFVINYVMINKNNGRSRLFQHPVVNVDSFFGQRVERVKHINPSNLI